MGALYQRLSKRQLWRRRRVGELWFRIVLAKQRIRSLLILPSASELAKLRQVRHAGLNGLPNTTSSYVSRRSFKACARTQGSTFEVRLGGHASIIRDENLTLLLG